MVVPGVLSAAIERWLAEGIITVEQATQMRVGIAAATPPDGGHGCGFSWVHLGVLAALTLAGAVVVALRFSLVRLEPRSRSAKATG